MANNKVLTMTFKTLGGSNANMMVRNPKADLTEAVVSKAMNDLVATTVFVGKDGAYQTPVKAVIAERTETILYTT